ncbi:MAG: hypothetical protein XU09_C0009G0029 [Thaumarchaeota archaeon CSP1-1]|nr:MAG: hypothetical protein XU09_C0009G0029 [Thaumarchaeota archaeon CSP1-1]
MIEKQRFFITLKTKTIDEIINTNKEFKTGEQRSFFIVSVLKKYKIIAVGCQTPNIIKEAKNDTRQDIEEALDIVQNDFGSNTGIS